MPRLGKVTFISLSMYLGPVKHERKFPRMVVESLKEKCLPVDCMLFYKISSSWNVVLRVFAAAEALVCVRVRKGMTTLAPPLYRAQAASSPPSLSQSTQQHLG